MAFELSSARHWARSLVEAKLHEGMRAIDATMGNGGDTEWLCMAVGEDGMVYGFDVQPQALRNASLRLEQAGLHSRAQLFMMGHEHMAECVSEPVDAIVFNLGWLPGGDKAVTTRKETTLRALDACLGLMAPGALLTICAYPGHDEGEREYQAALGWAQALPKERFQARITAYVNQPPHTPALIAVHRIGQ